MSGRVLALGAPQTPTGLPEFLGHEAFSPVEASIASREFAGTARVAALGRSVVLVFAGTSVLDGLGVVEDFVLLAFGGLLGALCLALGPSCGFGGREVTGEIVRERYEELRGSASGPRTSPFPAE
jgi:hypothetical protein